MDRKTKLTALLICVILFVAAAAASILITREDHSVPGSTGHIVLSEILASNRTYPAPNGQCLDFIEVRNLSDRSTDISGYMLSDDGNSIGYTFPAGTILPPNGYAICWCWKDAESADYAAFGISKDGGDTICLYNSANVMVDSKEVPRMESNVSLIRREDGTWDTSTLVTPGYENSESGYAAWLSSMGGSRVEILISEVMTANSCTAISDTMQVCDWVELYNPGTAAAVLDGCYLSDDPAIPLKWQIPTMTIQPGQYAVIPCVGRGAFRNEADFALPAAGCTVTLTGTLGETISTVTVPALSQSQSWAMGEDASYSASYQPTPGFSNDHDGYTAWCIAIGAEDNGVRISEVMSRNRSTILSSNGILCDWVEIVNTGKTAADLSGAYLSDDPDEPAKWQIPQLVLQPGEYALIPCAGSNAADTEANFALSAQCSVILTGKAGNKISQVVTPMLGEDRSWALQSDGTYAESSLPTPGAENTQENYLRWLAGTSPMGSLAISEVMPSNDRYLRQTDGGYYDWAEFVNTSDKTIDLSNFFLSDDPDEPQKFQLPQKTLEPGERIVVILCGKAALAGSSIKAPFTLSRKESWLYVSTADGFSDYIRIYDVPYQGSVGRVDGKGIWYFTTPTPGSSNGTGVASISATPTVQTAPGIYNDVDSLTVELSGQGQLYYTLDGSLPSQSSNLYTGPLTLTKTAVIRFASFENGKLPSDPVTASYIINENHTLPVISIAANPGEFSNIYKNYTENIEIRGSFSIFEDGGSVTEDCGVKLYGHTALQLPKKNLKVNFRSKYGADVLSYPVYGEDGPEIFDSLCLRAGQDNPQAIIREELFTSLCADMGDNVLVQKTRYCIVYVNGEYYGIYAMKEAYNETYYAQNKGVSEESVTIAQAPAAYRSDVYNLLSFCATKDMKDPANYEYLCQHIDIDSLIDWMIIEGYSANGDVEQNLRYFRSTENGNRWQYALYDLDWAFYEHVPFSNMFSESVWQYKMLTRNIIKNPTFRQRFLERCSEVLETTLSTENVIKRIDELESILDPEVKRDRGRWGYNYNGWKKFVQSLRNFITKQNYMSQIKGRLQNYLSMTNAEVEKYFGRCK